MDEGNQVVIEGEVKTDEAETETVKEHQEQTELDDAVLAEMKTAFRMFDRNDDGNISQTELGTVMRVLGGNPTDAELNEIFSHLDEDNNGQIEFTEFVAIMEKHLKTPVDEEAEILDAFKLFDRNGDGYVYAADLKYVMHGLGNEITDEDVDRILAKGDIDGDGKLNYPEFVKLMCEK